MKLTCYGYNGFVFCRHPADVERFIVEVRVGGRRCFPLRPGEGVEV